MSSGCGVNNRKRNQEKIQICMIQLSAVDPLSTDRRAFCVSLYSSVFVPQFAIVALLHFDRRALWLIGVPPPFGHAQVLPSGSEHGYWYRQMQGSDNASGHNPLS